MANNEFYDPNNESTFLKPIRPGATGSYAFYSPAAASAQIAPKIQSSVTSASAQARYANNPFDINSDNPTERRQAKAYQDAVDQAAIDNAGKPAYPTFISSVGDNGAVKDIYKYTPGQVSAPNINQAPLREIENRALSAGPSAWLKLQQQQAGEKTANDLNTAANQVAGSQASTMSDLASRGGLSSGARERVAKSGGLAANAAMQGVRNNAQANDTNLQIADEATKTNLLQNLPGMEIANAAPQTAVQEFNTTAANQGQQYNIQNALNDVLQKNAFNINDYNEAMKAFAAGKTADATGGGGKK